MKIRITGARLGSYWYADKIGEVFSVVGMDEYGDFEVDRLSIEDYTVSPSDCVVLTDCPTCQGQGRLNDHECTVCKSKGYIE